ncbi:MAG: hypothetical protein WD232_07815 [Acidimicrobiales bacterium]
MPDVRDELNLAELDDGYLKVLLLLATRRATSSEPRRAGFWNGLAGVLGAEQEQRQPVTAIGGERAEGVQPGEMAEFEAVLEEFRQDLASLEAEYRASYGEMPAAGSDESS